MTDCLCRAPQCPLQGTCCHSLTGCGTHLCVVHDSLSASDWPAATERIIARELLFSLLWKLQRAPGGHCVPMALRENLKAAGRVQLACVETCAELWSELRTALFAECRGAS